MPLDDPACFRLDRIPVRPIHWLWRPYLACGKLALLDGDPGAGKSLFTADLAARLTRGGRMPDGSWRRQKANVLFLNAEDALDDTLRPRLDAAGADLARVFCLGGGSIARIIHHKDTKDTKEYQERRNNRSLIETMHRLIRPMFLIC